MRKLNGTDVRMLAKGYWDNYFNWRLHPKAKGPFIAACATLGLLVVLLVANIGGDPMPAAVRALFMLTSVAFAATALWTVFQALKERDLFLDVVQDLWEKSEVVPDRETVVTYIESGGKRWKE